MKSGFPACNFVENPAPNMQAKGTRGLCNRRVRIRSFHGLPFGKVKRQLKIPRALANEDAITPLQLSNSKQQGLFSVMVEF
jgi:hypothetical protein